MAISRVTAVWSGFSGAPGYTNFFFDAFGGGDVVDLEVDRVHAFFQAIREALPTGVVVQVQQEAAIIDEATGELQSYAQSTDPAPEVLGYSTDAYSAPSGACVTWNTEAIARGRRLRGRTFIVPLGSDAYDAQGNLTNQAIGFLNAGATALIGDGSGPQMVIWSRPRAGVGGSIGAVTSHRVADKAAVLRSRRD